MLPLVVSTLAPIVSCCQMLPQLIKTWKTKEVSDLSLFTLFLVLFANILWLTHGYFIFDTSLIVAGIISLFVNGLLVFMYFFYK